VLVGIISDTHGDREAFRIAWENYLKDAEIILHAGDVLYHGPRNFWGHGYDPHGLAEDLNRLPVPLFIARGNCDAPVDQLVLEYPLCDPGLELEIEGMKVLVYHGDKEDPWHKKKKAQLLITGHTHIPEIKKEGSLLHLNPGSPALPKGGAPPTIALWEDNSICIISLIDGKIYKNIKLID